MYDRICFCTLKVTPWGMLECLCLTGALIHIMYLFAVTLKVRKFTKHSSWYVDNDLDSKQAFRHIRFFNFNQLQLDNN